MYVVKETQTPIFKSSDVASQHPPNFPAIVPDASSERPPLGEGPFRRSSHFALGPTSPRREASLFNLPGPRARHFSFQEAGLRNCPARPPHINRRSSAGSHMGRASGRERVCQYV